MLQDSFLNRINQSFIPFEERLKTEETSKSFCFLRGVHLLLGGLNLIVSALDTLIGFGLSWAVIVTLGRKQILCQRTFICLQSGMLILSVPFRNLICAINPNASFPEDDPQVSFNGNGLITNFFVTKLHSFAYNCFTGGVIDRHVVSRITFIALGLTCLVTRVIDLVIGIFASLAAIFTCGRKDLFNNVAYRGLQISGIIVDIIYCTIKAINPWAGYTRQEILT